MFLSLPFSTFALAPPALVSPPNGTIVLPGQSFTVTSFALDMSVTRLLFYEDNVLIATTFGTTASFTWNNSTIGVHTYKVLAMDWEGATATSSEIKILTSAPDSLATFFPEFTSAAGLTLEKRAAIVENFLRLTPNTPGPQGAAWFPTRQLVTHGFDTVFQFRIKDLVSGGADGIAFVIEGTPASVLGTGIGFSGVTNCLAVEYDTFKNSNHSDPNDNHISVHSRGILQNTNWENLASLGWTTNIPNMSDGAVHTTRIVYAPPELMVFLDDLAKPALVVDVDLSTYLYLEGGSAWVGLTATIGASMETHDIMAWSFTRVLDPLPRIDHIQMQGDGTMLLGYPTLPGLHYRMQYSSDFLNWIDSSSIITGTGARVNWTDFGPPETNKRPNNLPNRYYRLRVLP